MVRRVGPAPAAQGRRRRAAAGRHDAGRAAAGHPRAPAAAAAASRRLLDATTSCPSLRASSGIRSSAMRELDDAKQAALRRYFEDEIFPVLTPLAFDPATRSRTSPTAASTWRWWSATASSGERFARVKVPATFPRLLLVPEDDVTARRHARAVAAWGRQLRARPLSSGSRRWSPPTSTCSSRVSRSSTPIRSASPATPTSRSKRTRPPTCSPRWRRWSSCATSARSSGSRSTARCRSASATS